MIYAGNNLQNGRTLLHWAALSGKVELVQFLLDSQSAANLPDDVNI